MSVKNKIAKSVIRRFAKRFIMTPARKLALKKAQRAAAKAAIRRGKKIVLKKTMKKVASLKLKRSASGFISNSASFKGAEGRLLRKATYAARLTSSRAKYKAIPLNKRLLNDLMGGQTGSGIMTRRYEDLTWGENYRRQLLRNAKGVAVIYGTATVGTVAAIAHTSDITYKKLKNT